MPTFLWGCPMRVARLFLTFLIFVAIPTALLAQQAAQPIQRDPQAVALLQAAAAAMGGTVPADSVAAGKISITAGSKTESGTIRLLTRGFNQTAEHVDTEEGKRAVIYARNRAVEVHNGSVQKLWMELVVTSRSVLFPVIPLADALGDPETGYEYVGRETLAGVLVEHLRFWKTFASSPDLQDLAEFTVIDLWVDSASGLPHKLAYERRPAGGDAIGIRVEVYFSDYRNAGWLVYPFQIKKSLNGTPWATITIESVALNTGLTDLDFPVGKGAQ